MKIKIILLNSCSIIPPPVETPAEPGLKDWTCYNGDFSNRAWHSSIHQSSSSSDYYIISGTLNGITGLNDVWVGDISSSNMTCLTPSAGFGGRWGHTSVKTIEDG